MSVDSKSLTGLEGVLFCKNRLDGFLIFLQLWNLVTYCMALTHLIVKGVEICAISEGKIKYKLHHCIFAPCFHLGDWLVATECPLSAYSPLFYSELVHNLIFSRWIESCRGWWPWSPSSPSSSATMDSPKEWTSHKLFCWLKPLTLNSNSFHFCVNSCLR